MAAARKRTRSGVPRAAKRSRRRRKKRRAITEREKTRAATKTRTRGRKRVARTTRRKRTTRAQRRRAVPKALKRKPKKRRMRATKRSPRRNRRARTRPPPRKKRRSRRTRLSRRRRSRSDPILFLPPPAHCPHHSARRCTTSPSAGCPRPSLPASSSRLRCCLIIISLWPSSSSIPCCKHWPKSTPILRISPSISPPLFRPSFLLRFPQSSRCFRPIHRKKSECSLSRRRRLRKTCNCRYEKTSELRSLRRRQQRRRCRRRLNPDRRSGRPRPLSASRMLVVCRRRRATGDILRGA